MSKKTMFFKLMSLMLAILMLSSMLASCGSKGGDSDSGSDNQTSTAAGTNVAKPTEAEKRAKVSDNLPEKDYNAASFNVLVRNNDRLELSVDAESGETINDAVYKRNNTVSERFKVELNYIKKAGGSEFSEAVTASAAASDNAYDMILGSQADLALNAMNGELKDVGSITGINLENPWWVKNANSNLTIGDKLYLASGDLSLTMWQNMYVTFFNMDVVSSYSLKSPIDLVNGDAWTFDRYIELAMNSQGSYNTFVGSSENFASQFAVSVDSPIAKKGDDGYPELVFNTDKTEKIASRLAELYTSKNITLIEGLAKPGISEIPVEFAGGTSLFMTGFLGDTPKVASSVKFNFGILPMPKYDEYQNGYLTTAYGDCSMIAFTGSIKDPEMSGIITEALNAESYKQVVPALFNAYKTAEDSTDMLKIMRDGMSFDFGMVYSAVINNIAQLIDSVASGASANFKEAYAANETAYSESFDAVVNAFKNIG